MVNKVILVGRLTRDSEIRYTSSGTPVASFSIATNQNWTDADGKQKTEVEFHNIVAWSRLAEVCEQYLKKGKLVYIEGRLQTQKWDDKQGNPRSKVEVVANIMTMLDSKDSQDDQEKPDPAANEVAPNYRRPDLPDDDLLGDLTDKGYIDMDDDDIPFMWILPIILGGYICHVLSVALNVVV